MSAERSRRNARRRWHVWHLKIDGWPIELTTLRGLEDSSRRERISSRCTECKEEDGGKEQRRWSIAEGDDRGRRTRTVRVSVRDASRSIKRHEADLDETRQFRWASRASTSEYSGVWAGEVDLRRVFRHLGALPSPLYYTNFSGMSKYLSCIYPAFRILFDTLGAPVVERIKEPPKA